MCNEYFANGCNLFNSNHFINFCSPTIFNHYAVAAGVTEKILQNLSLLKRYKMEIIQRRFVDHFDEMSQSKMLDARLPELQSKPSVLQVFVLNKFSLMREDHFKNFTVSASGQPSK